MYLFFDNLMLRLMQYLPVIVVLHKKFKLFFSIKLELRKRHLGFRIFHFKLLFLN